MFRCRYGRRGHYHRALEEAVQAHSSQWPRSWQGQNPLHGGKTFASMTPEERVSIFRVGLLGMHTSGADFFAAGIS